jgi:hypothetical protein
VRARDTGLSSRNFFVRSVETLGQLRVQCRLRPLLLFLRLAFTADRTGFLRSTVCGELTINSQLSGFGIQFRLLFPQLDDAVSHLRLRQEYLARRRVG